MKERTKREVGKLHWNYAKVGPTSAADLRTTPWHHLTATETCEQTEATARKHERVLWLQKQKIPVMAVENLEKKEDSKGKTKIKLSMYTITEKREKR